eukprot:CAMPEP_0174918704 /NCGR_PEP_ID=MMETSP1355-20121228/3235_1 /TAXON_ID=464990 /ORGANISM="Hemiselmis tepida, Strain CCMP443" /LENGTH=129 /DNA_ID=CAMNT_0016163891 /DNA_START=32 /DNA_END=418 /DNA_ORIENTATION=+
MSFAGSESDGSLTLGVADPSVDSLVSFPEASGRIVTTGSLPSVMDGVTVIDGTVVRGSVRMRGDVSIGPRLARTTLDISAPIASAFPMTFGGASGANGRLSLGVPDPTEDRMVVLPDVSGTVLTTASLP